ncbi:type III secretion system export apparatus subunit SctU [Trinickia acidisoli]|uniref:type III secretion system export apparatus subunit SctU n=1 Tax=Trinickia acidisoli TaxID=2767482 RepID=UPI001A8E5DAD|nr:type III secretion system export apparatus subunit SctU [Trinickia acidisoli]
MSEKTEQPTQKKLEDAREKGQVAKSPDLTETVCMLGVIGVLTMGEHIFADALRGLVTQTLTFVSGDHSQQSILHTLYHLLGVAVTLVLPIAGAGAFAAAVGTAAQAGLVVAFEPVMPKFDAINPGAGLKRIFSMRALIDVGKRLLKLAVLLPVMWVSIEKMLPLISSASYQPLGPLMKVLWQALLKLLTTSFVAYLVIGFADFKIQKWLFIRQNRMSKDEIKRERKQQDGDPQVKRERRKRGREMINKGPDKPAVGSANVVVTNPTHYAVAIRFRPGEDPLPVVVAKGVDQEAALVRRYATEAGIPIVANPPVARALYRIEQDAPIPEAMFEVVAAILRWVDSVGAPRIGA